MVFKVAADLFKFRLLQDIGIDREEASLGGRLTKIPAYPPNL